MLRDPCDVIVYRDLWGGMTHVLACSGGERDVGEDAVRGRIYLPLEVRGRQW